jgi:gas vesicle protein
MNEHMNRPRDSGFGLGLFIGACAGAGLALWLAPRMTAEIRERVTDSAGRLRQRASKRYEQAEALVSDAVQEITLKGQGLRDEVAGAVAHGARVVERAATSVQK